MAQHQFQLLHPLPLFHNVSFIQLLGPQDAHSQVGWNAGFAIQDDR